MKNFINLDHASVGSLLPEVETTITHFLKDWRRGKTSHWLNLYEQSKQSFAELVGATPDRVAGTPNVSTAAGLVARSIPLGPRSNIVLSGLEFPSNVYPWLATAQMGVSIKVAKRSQKCVPLAEFEKLIDDNTVIVAVSHVVYTTGYRYRLEDLVDVAHRKNAFLFVDAYQSVGTVKVDVEEAGVDFLCTGSNKWLMGPPGTGFLYVKDEVSEKLHPPIPSWIYGNLYDLSPSDFEGIRGANKFETGTPNFIGYAGILASIQRINEYGINNIEQRILSLTQWFIDELEKLGLEVITPRQRNKRAGIVLFQTKQNSPTDVIQRLWKEGIIVWKRSEGGVRTSIHYTNQEDEIEYVVKTLRRMDKEGLL